MVHRRPSSVPTGRTQERTKCLDPALKVLGYCRVSLRDAHKREPNASVPALKVLGYYRVSLRDARGIGRYRRPSTESAGLLSGVPTGRGWRERRIPSAKRRKCWAIVNGPYGTGDGVCTEALMALMQDRRMRRCGTGDDSSLLRDRFLSMRYGWACCQAWMSAWYWKVSSSVRPMNKARNRSAARNTTA